MHRRLFLQTAALAGAAATLACSSAGASLPMPTTARPIPPPAPRLDPADRSPGRDPLAVQRATLVVEGRDAGGDTSEQLERLRQGGINCSVADRGGLAGIGASYRFLDLHGDTIAPAGTVAGIRRVHEQGRIARVFHFEGADPLEPEADWRPALRAYHQLGVRIAGLANNIAGRFGGGLLDSHIGLTRAGRALVEEIHELGIVLDVAGHTGDQTTLDAIEMSRGVPVICSHTNIRALADNPRNISDRLIEAIAGTGGVIGLTPISDFHVRTRNDVAVRRMPRVNLDTHLNQYDYLKRLVGEDHIALGIDNIEERAATFQGGLRYPEMYSDPGSFHYVEDFETIAKLPNVTRGLIERGWSNAEIWKVLGENWLRVYGRVWGG